MNSHATNLRGKENPHDSISGISLPYAGSVRRLAIKKSLTAPRSREVRADIRGIIDEYADIGWEVVFSPNGADSERLLIELIHSVAITEWNDGTWIDHPLQANGLMGYAFARSLAYFAVEDGEALYVPPCVKAMHDREEMKLAIYRSARALGLVTPKSRNKGLKRYVPSKTRMLALITMMIRY